MPLLRFSENIHILLSQHGGAMPLGRFVCPLLPIVSALLPLDHDSFLQCYAHYFPRLVDDEYGVPLEHYITCVKNVEIVTDQGVIKRIQTTITPSFSVPLNHSEAVEVTEKSPMTFSPLQWCPTSDRPLRRRARCKRLRAK